jgi:hypothetical protein
LRPCQSTTVVLPRMPLGRDGILTGHNPSITEEGERRVGALRCWLGYTARQFFHYCTTVLKKDVSTSQIDADASRIVEELTPEARG